MVRESYSGQDLQLEDKIAIPLTQVLLQAIPTSGEEPKPNEISKSLVTSLDELFPEQQYEEKILQRTKEILGEKSKEFTTEELKDTVSEVQYLCECWVDAFEREIFSGQTLQELLHDKGGL